MSNSWDQEDYYRDLLTEESEIAREEYELAIGEMHSAVDGDNDREWAMPVPKLSTVFKNWSE